MATRPPPAPASAPPAAPPGQATGKTTGKPPQKKPGKPDDLIARIPPGKKPSKKQAQDAMDALDMTQAEGAGVALKRRALKMR